MSSWAYLLGTIEVWVEGRTQAECDYIIKTVLAHLPLVTGSEVNMEVHVSTEDEEDSFSTDEFGNYSNLGERGWYDNYISFKRKPCYLITVKGNLRDKNISTTTREFCKWLVRLGKRVFVKDVFVKISGSCGEKVIIENENYCFTDLFDLENSWTDYLRPNIASE